MIELLPIEPADYLAWRAASEQEYAAELVQAGNLDAAGAAEKARDDFESRLPQGPASPDQWIFSIVNEAGEKAGILWFQCFNQPARREAFILDLIVYEPFRRRGYAEQAMLAAEAKARELGMKKMGLHVFAHNQGAIKLYEKLGYTPTNINMAKEIT